MTRPRKPKDTLPPLSPELEARMVYIPQDDRTRVVTVHIYEAERKRALAAADLMTYALSDASNVFRLIHDGLSSWHMKGNEAGVISLTNICAEHFKRLAENEGEHLQQLARTLARHVEDKKEQPE